MTDTILLRYGYFAVRQTSGGVDIMAAYVEYHATSVRGMQSHQVWSRVSRVVQGWFEGLYVWQQRWADRRALSSLGDHALKDIGLSRADIDYEASKPFWRA